MPINILSNTFGIKIGREDHLTFVCMQGPSTFSLNTEFITLASQFRISGRKLELLLRSSAILLLLYELKGSQLHSPVPNFPSALFIV